MKATNKKQSGIVQINLESCGNYNGGRDFLCCEALEMFKLDSPQRSTFSVSLKRFPGSKRFKFDKGGYSGKFRWFDKREKEPLGGGMRLLFENFSNFLKKELFPDGEYPKEFFGYILIEPR